MIILGSDLDLVVIGRVSLPYGLKGWIKVQSYTEPISNILNYSQWWLEAVAGWKIVAVSEGRKHGKGIVARLEGCHDRDMAGVTRGQSIAIKRQELPRPAEGEYYWFDLVGLDVESEKGDVLGKVDHLFKTGANDVMVVKQGEITRLIPYVKDETIQQVDMERGKIIVRWGIDY